MSSENDPNWQDLLPELVPAIAKRVTSISDYISFRGVRRSWRSSATFNNFDTEFPRLPYVMYVAEEVEKGEGKSILDENEKGEGNSILDEKEVVEVSDNRKGKPIPKKVVKIWNMDTDTHKITNFPPIYCALSCFGWILCGANVSTDVSLRHFLFPISIKLPDKKPLPHILKMVLSGSPMKSDCVVMVIWMCVGLAFCRPGDESWTQIGEGVKPSFRFCDIIYHNRKLYALVERGTTIYACDIHGSNPTKKLVQVFAFDGIFGQLGRGYLRSYLVESRGKFLIVSRYWESKILVNFWVFEIDLEDGSAEVIRDLGDRSIFLGTNSSICVEIPESSKFEPGRIYFTFSYPVWSQAHPNEGVYRLMDGHFENFFRSSGVRFPNWVVPSI